MELVPTLISTGWASGLNAWGTVLMLGLLGRAGFGTELVPEQLSETPVLVGAGVMYAIEFVTDKVPYLDSLWDLVSTVFRPAVGSAIGVEFAAADGFSSLDQAIAGGGGGGVALVSHAIKTSLRLGINASPEPVTNIAASLTEDGLVAAVTAFSLEQPELAAAIALVLMISALALVIVIWKRVRRAWTALRRRYGRAPPAA
jgi:hypothetical protein